VDGGAPDVPLSTGTFPYPGRWWASLAGAQLDGGVAVDRGPFVLHWSENDPTDRNLWTASGVFPVAVSAASDGSTTMLMDVPGTSGCWSVYPTSDAHSLQVQPCNRPPSSGTPPLGFFNDVPRLLAEIPLPPLGPSSNRLLSVNLGSTGVSDGGGQWAAFMVGSELWYWRADTTQLFDLGQSVGGSTVASPDGRWLLFFGYRSDPGEQFPSMYGLDTLTGTTIKIAESLVAGGAFGYSSLATFSPDSRRVAFYGNATAPNRGDLLAYEFASGQTTTLAPHAYVDTPSDSTVAFFASGDRVVFAAWDATMSFSTGSIPMYAYDFTTGATMSLGLGMILTPFPGRAYVALQTLTNTVTGDGQVLLLHDEAGFAPAALANVAGAVDFGTAGVFPDPAGAQVAYFAGGGALDIRSVTGGMPLTLDGYAVPMNLVLEPPPVGDGPPSRPVAAWFTTGGGIVHQVSDTTNNTYDLREYDPVSRSTISFAVQDGATFTTLTPMGDVVLSLGTSVTALVWPNAPVALDAPTGGDSQEYQTVYVFSLKDRYLTYQMNGYLMLRDFTASTTAQLARLTVPARSVTSPINGVSVVWLDGTTPMTGYAPDGTSWTIPAGSQPVMNPSGTAIAYSGTYVMSMQPNATPAMVGNGAPLAVTDTQVIFRDLDGVCATALPAP
jgi:hypothetical protein